MSEPTEKGIVVIGRKWANPEIYAFVEWDGVGIKTTLSDYVSSLGHEIDLSGLRFWWSASRKRNFIVSRLRDAAERTDAELKTATRSVIG